MLTVVRILLVPVLVVALLGNTPDGDVFAAIVFAVASLTDFVDGYIARSSGSVTTFGKLMDPLADKLLVIAALVSLVSLGRLDAWVAMVIIAREVAVTVLRAGAAQQGVVIAASWLGKLKTCVQIAAIFSLIAFPGNPLWVTLLVYAAVVGDGAVGPGLLLGLRRRLREAAASAVTMLRSALTTPARRAGRGLDLDVEPAAQVGVAPRQAATGDLRADLRQGAVALGDDVVLVDRLEVLLACGHEALVRAATAGPARRRRSSRVRSPRRSADGGAPSPPPRPRRCASSARRSPRTSSPSTIASSAVASMRSSLDSGRPMRSVPSPRWLCVATGTCWRIRSISSSLKSSAARRSRARAAIELLGARAGRHAGRGHADDAARAVLGGDGGAEQRVHLLRGDPRHGRRLVLGVAGGDRHLGAGRLLALAHELGDVHGQRLGAERGLADHDARRSPR